MALPIPQRWLEDVCAILRSGDKMRIRTTDDFSRRSFRDFQGSTQPELEAAFLEYLKGPDPVGCAVKMNYPAGTTWEFFFVFQGQKTYGKILLRTDRHQVLLFSAHRPERPRLRCD